MPKLLHQKLTGTLIKTYFDVYNGTSRTYPEFIYERALQIDLQKKGIPYRRQPEYQIIYKGKIVGIQQLDLFIAGEIVIEIKVVPQLTRLHKAQSISYLKVVDKHVGLLLNFGNETPEFKRLYFSQNRPYQYPPNISTDWPTRFLSPKLTETIIGGLFEVHSTLGPGFIHRIYANAVFHELSHRGLDIQPRREYQVLYRGRSIGELKFNHLQIANDIMIFPVATQTINNISINNLKAWMSTQNIPLGLLANFYPTSLEFIVLRT